MTIWCIGNSHSSFFTGTNTIAPSWEHAELDTIPGIRTHNLGPAIAYNFYTSHLPNVIEFCRQNVTQKDFVLMMIAEVDARWWMPFYSDRDGRYICDVIYECFHRYFNSILVLKEMGYNVGLWGVHPSTHEGHCSDKDRPVFGTMQYRNEITRYWNYLSKLNCELHSMPFVNIFDKLVDEVDGQIITKPNTLFDYCHLSQNAMPFALEELKRLKLYE